MAGTTARAPRKRAAASKRTTTSAAPADFAGLNLDTLDKKEVLPDVTDVPFEFLLDGHLYTMMDPRDVDWKRILDGIGNPILFMRLALDNPDEADKFIDVKLPGWKLSALFDRWQKHYGVDGLTDLNQLLAVRPARPDVE